MKSEHSILGLLQNQWVRNPKRVKEILSRQSPLQQRRFLASLLFSGSLSGRRLKVAFGRWTDRIIWANASPFIAGVSRANPTPDLAHVRQIVADVQPHIVLAFGLRATWALNQLPWTGLLIRGPHPAARMPDIEEQLLIMRQRLETYNDETLHS